MSAFLLFIFILLAFTRGLPAQDYRFIRKDGVYQLVEPRGRSSWRRRSI